MAALPPPWDAFMAVVEGRESITSAGLVNGLPAFNPAPIPPGAPPDLAMLAACLRSAQPIPNEVRLWLADLVDPAGASTMHLTRRERGQPVRPLGRHWDAVDYYEKLLSETHTKDAIHQTCIMFGIKRSTFMSAQREHKRAKDEDDRVTRQA